MNRQNIIQDVTIFFTIFEQSPINTQIFSPIGDAILVNHAWEKLWGIKFSEVKGYNILKDKQLIKSGIMPLVKKAFKGEVTLLPAIQYDPQKTVPGLTDVEFRIISAQMYPIKNYAGDILCIVIQHIDITEQKQMEEKVQDSERFFKSITENSLDGVRLIDAKGNITYASPSTSKILGYTPEEYKKINVFNHVHPEDRKKYKKAMDDLLLHPKKTISLTYRMQHKNGQMRWMEGRGRNFLKDPNIKALISNFRDVTEKTIAENKLWETNQTLNAIIQASPLAVYVVDRKGNVMMWSTAAERMFGWTKEEAIGHSLPIVQPEMKDEHKQLMKKLLSGKSFTKETVRRRKDGTLFDVSISAAPILDEKGNVITIVAITADITERKSMERQKDDFMAIVSHELKTPVTSLKAFGQVLERKFERAGDSDSASFLKKMDTQIDKLTALIKDLLDVTKIEAGKMQMQKEPFSIDDVIDETIEEVQRTTEKHTILKKGTTKKVIIGDRDRISQVIMNLLTNAVKYSPDSENIIVSASSEKKNVIITVRDFGVGIPSSAMEHLFTRFYRVNAPTHNTVPGIGLGLFISADIIRRHHGKIWVERTVKKGSKFIFSLPTK